jgi:hypothetical protein
MYYNLIPVSNCCGEPFMAETMQHLELRATCPKCAEPCTIDYAIDPDYDETVVPEDYGH